MPLRQLTGDQAFAYGALAANIDLVASYPGSPSSGTVECLIPLAKEHHIYLEWSSNERVALEMAIGASIVGRRALVCTKSVGMNVMLDPLMALNLTPVAGGLVILLGDDPGGYGSQNDQDTRPLALMLEMPMLEPATPAEAYEMVREAFELSERFRTAVIVRETRSFSQQTERVEIRETTRQDTRRNYEREPHRFVPVPSNVVEKHRVLHQQVNALQEWAEESSFVRIRGHGDKGLIAAGFAFRKVQDVVDPTDFNLLKLGVLYPLPGRRILEFLRTCSEVLVIEEIEPFVEMQLKALAHDHGCATRIYGKQTGHVNGEGELFRWQIQKAIQKFQPRLTPRRDYLEEDENEERPEKRSHCDECHYDEVLDLLDEAADAVGRKLLLVGDPGCLVTVSHRLDAKYAIGSAVAVADGMQKAGATARPVALIGDSGFFHSTLSAMCNAVHNRSSILMIVLDNGTTLTSGGQPHPGVGKNALGENAPKLSIPEIAKACGIRWLRGIDLNRPAELKACFQDALRQDSLAMVIVKIL